ncbi:MAG TPA: hypothetical protein VM677_10100, partial [Actinokineospora sp.]|nr:hypothetical protein [Actinokineospora sp.]
MAVVVIGQVGVGQLGAGGVAAADPGPDPGAEHHATGLVKQDPTVVAPAVERIDPVPPVDPGPDGSVSVERENSKALQDIPALPGLNPAAGAVPVPKGPVTPQPPVSPYQLTLPQRPGQELVDATAADALATLGRAGRLGADGKPALDANALQPQVPSAQVIDPTRPATL